MPYNSVAMIATAIKRAIWGFLGSALLGVCLFGVPLALWGALDALKEPVVLDGKRRGMEQTVIGRSTECFCAGAFVGGCAGAITGLGVAAARVMNAIKTPRDS
jgi:hypothetical protein